MSQAGRSRRSSAAILRPARNSSGHDPPIPDRPKNRNFKRSPWVKRQGKAGGMRNRIDVRYGQGRDGGNHFADVAEFLATKSTPAAVETYTAD